MIALQCHEELKQKESVFGTFQCSNEHWSWLHNLGTLRGRHMSRLVQPIHYTDLGNEKEFYSNTLQPVWWLEPTTAFLIATRLPGGSRMVQENIGKASTNRYTIFFGSVHHYLRIHLFFQILEIGLHRLSAEANFLHIILSKCHILNLLLQ